MKLQKTARFKEHVVKALEGSLALSEVERHVALLPDRYVRVTRPTAAAVHLHLIKELQSDVFVRRWTRYGRESTELTVCTRDRHGLCADIAGALAAHGIEILSAELNTREDGIALDVFMLREASTHNAIDMQRYSAIERSLRNAIAGESDIAASSNVGGPGMPPGSELPLAMPICAIFPGYVRQRSFPIIHPDRGARPR